jgi:hypothetical protein
MSKSRSAIICSKIGFLNIDVRISRIVIDSKTPLKKQLDVLLENLLGTKGINAFNVKFRLALFRLTQKVISIIFKNDLYT